MVFYFLKYDPFINKDNISSDRKFCYKEKKSEQN